MKIAYVLHFYEKNLSTREMLEKHYSTIHNVEALSKQGIKVFVFYRFHHDAVLERNGISYHFIKDNLGANPKKWQACRKYNQAVTKIIGEHEIDLIQAHNPFSALCHRHLQSINKTIPYLVQDHSGLVRLKNEKLLRHFLKNIDGIQLSAPGMEKPWIEKKIFSNEQTHPVMEASCEWRLDKKLLQQYNPTNVPRFLWVGNLNVNKDPLLVLNAMAEYKMHNPNFRLQMIFRENQYEDLVKSFITENNLVQQVDLIGSVPRERLYLQMHQNDYFIAASHKEGSGYAMMEAMACGLMPITTRIPSFIELTKNASIGFLYPTGDVESLSKILLGLPRSKVEFAEKKKTVEFFDKHFSYEAIAKRMKFIYKELIARKKAS